MYTNIVTANRCFFFFLCYVFVYLVSEFVKINIAVFKHAINQKFYIIIIPDVFYFILLRCERFYKLMIYLYWFDMKTTSTNIKTFHRCF